MTLSTLDLVSDSAGADNQLSALCSQLAGRLITSESADFDEARKILSITADRHPLAVVQVASAQDVATAVTFARANGIPLSVRSGGHSIAHHSVIDDAIVVDFSAMKRVSVDPQARTARVQAGATSSDLAGPTQEHGLAISTGDTHSVGISGLTLGGGVGFMVRRFGLAIDNLVSAEVVTATGDIICASADEHPELFWAIRGGGGNFGIVTELTFNLAPVGQILGGELMLPASREVLRGYLDYVTSAPDDLTTIANLMHAPPAPHVPVERIGELVVSILVTWTGSLEDGEQALAPLRALATPVVDVVNPMPYSAMYNFTAHQAIPHAASLRMMFADELSDSALDAALAAMERATSPYSLIQLRGLGGAYARVDNDATAFAHRDRRYFVSVIALWLDPTEVAATHQAWTEALWQTLRSEGSGAYVNFLENEGADRVREAYPGDTFARLQRVKQQYDPENIFRFNQNIPPAS